MLDVDVVNPFVLVLVGTPVDCELTGVVVVDEGVVAEGEVSKLALVDELLDVDVKEGELVAVT